MLKLPPYILKLLPPELVEAIEFDQTYLPIRISDCQETLVNVENTILQSNLLAEFNRDLTITNQEKLFYLRKGVAEKLLHAVEILNKKGYVPKFEYMYRRLEDQEKHFRKRVTKIMELYPDLDDQTTLLLTGVFTAANPDGAAHISGAAVDLVLLDKNFQSLDMGCPFNHPGPESKTESKAISSTEIKNRQILKEAMNSVGFTNYPFEYWHYSLGDKIDAKVKNRSHAIYGPIIFEVGENRIQPVKGGDKMFDVSDLLEAKSLRTNFNSRTLHK